MDPEDVSNLIAGLALLVSAVAVVRGEFSRRAGARQAKQADEAAERSAAALERMADQWAESLSRQEKRDRRQWSQGRRLPPREEMGGGPWMGPPTEGRSEPVVHWTVDRIKGRQHMLRNLGRATAYEVELTTENAVRFDGPEPRDIGMGEAVEFLAIGSMQTGTPELLVTWSDTPGGERRTWRRPVP